MCCLPYTTCGVTDGYVTGCCRGGEDGRKCKGWVEAKVVKSGGVGRGEGMRRVVGVAMGLVGVEILLGGAV